MVLASDTRATSGFEVAEKNCTKLHPVAPNMYAAGAGTAADLHHQTGTAQFFRFLTPNGNFIHLDRMRAELELIRLNTGRESQVRQACTRITNHLFKYQGHIGVALIIGGVDIDGPTLATIAPNG